MLNREMVAALAEWRAAREEGRKLRKFGARLQHRQPGPGMGVVDGAPR